jgi:arylsulfatase A-like enzyme
MANGHIANGGGLRGHILRHRPPFLFKVLIVIQTAFLTSSVCGRSFSETCPFLIKVFVTYLSLYLLVQLVISLTPRIPFASSGTPIGVATLYALACFYHFRSTEAFSYALLKDNFAELFSREAFLLVQSRLQIMDWILCLAIFLACGLIEIRTHAFASDVLSRRWSCWFIPTVAAYACMVMLPFGTFDEVGLFLRSCYVQGVALSNGHVEGASCCYPYLSKAIPACGTNLDATDRPHVFLLLIESFNASFVEATTSDGKSYTPFFNSLISKGIFASRFYGNSVYTIKGQEAILCSIPPTIKGTIAANYSKLNVKGLPSILRDHNYTTMFFHAYKDITFHKTDKLMTKVGFEHVYAMDSKMLTAEDAKHVWGWGLQDDRFYKKVFAKIDELSMKATEGSEPQRFFITLATISSHAPFNTIPQGQRTLYPYPKTTREHYANTIRAVDTYLHEFFGLLQARPYLSNSVVIVLGDHGYPVGEHGNYSNEAKYFEENFRTPFLLLWGGHITPRRIEFPLYSQLDVAPTVLALLQITAPNHFVGRSIYQNSNCEEAAQLLLQPYGGRYLIAVKYPYKYVLHMAESKEYVFNLAMDPEEAKNVLFSMSRDALGNLRKAAGHLIFNQESVERNRIWRPKLSGSDYSQNGGGACP